MSVVIQVQSKCDWSDMKKKKKKVVRGGGGPFYLMFPRADRGAERDDLI